MKLNLTMHGTLRTYLTRLFYVLGYAVQLILAWGVAANNYIHD